MMDRIKLWIRRNKIEDRSKNLWYSIFAGVLATGGYAGIFDRGDKPPIGWDDGEFWVASLLLIFGSAYTICGLIGTMRGWDTEETGDAFAKLALTVIIGLSVLVGLLFIYPALARFIEDTPAWAVTIIILAVIIIILLVGILNSLTRRKE